MVRKFLLSKKCEISFMFGHFNFLVFQSRTVTQTVFLFGLKFVRHCQMVSSASAIYIKMISLRIQPLLIRSRYYVQNSKRDSLFCVTHVVVGANERRLHSQATK